MKIGVKIGVGFGGLIVLLLVVGVVGIASLRQTIDGYGDEVMAKVYHGQQIAEIPLLISTAQRFEKEFVSTSNNAYAREVNDHLDLAEYEAEQLEEVVSHPQSRQQMIQIQARIGEYRREFAILRG